MTGLVVNRFPNVPRAYIRQLGGLLHAWEIYGPDATAVEFFRKHDRKGRSSADRDLLKKVVRGKIAFVGRVRGTDDPVYRKLLLVFVTKNPRIENSNR